jgi:uncharacterized membrane protein YkoI
MKRKSVIAAAVVVALVGGGTATALSLPSEAGPKAAPGVSADANRADVNRAVGTAASTVPGTVTGVDLEDDGREWDVDVFGKDGKWHDVTLDPSGVKVRDDHVDTGNDDRDDHAPKGADVTAQQAVDSALRTAAPGGRVTEADLERGHWEIEVLGKDGRHQDINVDAKTGKAVVAPKDQDDDGADNAADDRAATDSDD